MTREWIRDGKLVVVGITQEQHPERCRLFAQWQQIDWPILHDPINVVQVKGVPIEIAIDEYGVVRNLSPRRENFEESFIEKTFDPPEVTAASRVARRPDVTTLRLQAQNKHSAEAWIELGDALVLWHGTAMIDDAIDAYTQALQLDADSGDTHFRLGVCYRMRSESQESELADFQMAAKQWGLARKIDPNQYIWRRRIEQYGPRATKPYPFYDWVDTAAHEIRSRGETPVALRRRPTASEMALPQRGNSGVDRGLVPPDPDNRVTRDARGLIGVDVAVVPATVQAGASVRVHVTLRPNEQLKAHWNNEAEPLRLWIEAPSAWQVRPPLVVAPQGRQAETAEIRRLEFDVVTPAGAAGDTELVAYALYYVCEDAGGLCHFLRQDVPVVITIAD